MRDEKVPYGTHLARENSSEPIGVLQRALYLWERQSPASASESRSPIKNEDNGPAEFRSESPRHGPQPDQDNKANADDMAVEDGLQHHVARLNALERIIPNDRRLDSPRFSLMMLNAFLGRAASDGTALSRLPGFSSISERIDKELTELEKFYPEALRSEPDEAELTPRQLRNDIRLMAADLAAGQKAQQRQIASSFSAIHAALAELRRHISDSMPSSSTPPILPTALQSQAEPLVDSERMIDPRPVLAAARAAASRATREAESDSIHDPDKKPNLTTTTSFRSVLIGSALIGMLMMIFGREAVQFLTPSSLQANLLRP